MLLTFRPEASLEVGLLSVLLLAYNAMSHHLCRLSANAQAPPESPMSSNYGTPQRSAATSPAPSKGAVILDGCRSLVALCQPARG